VEEQAIKLSLTQCRQLEYNEGSVYQNELSYRIVSRRNLLIYSAELYGNQSSLSGGEIYE